MIDSIQVNPLIKVSSFDFLNVKHNNVCDGLCSTPDTMPVWKERIFNHQVAWKEQVQDHFACAILAQFSFSNGLAVACFVVLLRTKQPISSTFNFINETVSYFTRITQEDATSHSH